MNITNDKNRNNDKLKKTVLKYLTQSNLINKDIDDYESDEQFCPYNFLAVKILDRLGIDAPNQSTIDIVEDFLKSAIIDSNLVLQKAKIKKLRRFTI